MNTIVIFFVFGVSVVAKSDNFLPEEDYYRFPYERLSNTSACLQQYSLLLNESVFDFLKLIDSSSKVPTGLLSLNIYDLGNFDECLGIKAATSGGTVYGKYCLISIPVEVILGIIQQVTNAQSRALGTPGFMGLHNAYCIPSACTAEEATEVTGGTLLFLDKFCYSRDSPPEWDWGAVVTLVILAFFLTVLVVSTIYDIFLLYSEKKAPHPLYIAFSALSNGKKLISSTKNPDQLLCLNGMKAISMLWVLIAHEFLLAISGPVANITDVINWVNDQANMFITNSSLSVDTFFAVGGMVIVYTFLKSADRGVKFNLPMYYIHRYLRLTPTLAIAVLMHATLIKYMGEGPAWPIVEPELMNECKENWWAALLYIQNYIGGGDSCIPQAWYLSIDFQLFVLSPAVLIPLKRWPKYGLSLLGVLIIGGIVSPFAIGYVYNITLLPPNSGGDPLVLLGGVDAATYDLMYRYYKQTYGRFGPYVIGMLAGYYIYKLRKSGKRIDMHPNMVLGAWMLTIAGLLACLYASFYSTTRWEKAAAMGFQRNAWGLGICIMTFLCVSGNGGPINAFLSMPIFQFLSKVSYSMYLVHYALLIMRYASSKQTYEFSNRRMMWSFWSDLVLTLVVSVLLCLTFESPVVILEKFIFGGGSKPKKLKKTEEP